MQAQEYMVRRERFHVVDVVGDVGQWSAVHGVFRFGKESVELRVCKYMVMHQSRHYFLYGSHQAFPYATHVGGLGRIEVPHDLQGSRPVVDSFFIELEHELL